MDPILYYSLLLIAGIVGGFLNSVASSGAAVMLPLLISLGLPPAIANATNRVPIVAGFITSTIQFQRKKLINWNIIGLLFIPMLVGTVIGVKSAESLNPAYFEYVIIFALCVALVLALTKSKQILTRPISKTTKVTIATYALFFLMGIWSGLIILDTATFILFTLTLHLGLDLIPANAIKSAICLILSFMSLFMYGLNGQVDWQVGAVLSIGSITGGYLGSSFAMKEQSKKWIFRILITVLSTEIILALLKVL